MAIYELDPVDRIAVEAVGEPGRRRFYPLATGSGRTLTLGCEKSQIQALILRMHQMLEAQQIEPPEELPFPASGEPRASAGVWRVEPHSATDNPGEPGDPEWQIGEMG